MSDADLAAMHRSFSDAPPPRSRATVAAHRARDHRRCPVAGPYMLAGVNRAVAGIRALKNDSRYSDELKAVEDFGTRTAEEHPIADIAGHVGGGVVGTVPLVMAARPHSAPRARRCRVRMAAFRCLGRCSGRRGLRGLARAGTWARSRRAPRSVVVSALAAPPSAQASARRGGRSQRREPACTSSARRRMAVGIRAGFGAGDP